MRGNPGYLVDFLGGKCLYLKDAFGKRLAHMEALNKKRGWQQVVFPSRGDMRGTDALYFPSQRPGASPRVVLVHGIAANFLDGTVQTAAFYLRRLNISSLVPNL